jgi:hypothetical protein
MYGKKTVRMKLSRQICLSETMALEIQHRAERGFRSLEDQLRFLIYLGLEREDQIYSNEQAGTCSHQRSLFNSGRPN